MKSLCLCLCVCVFVFVFVHDVVTNSLHCVLLSAVIVVSGSGGREEKSQISQMTKIQPNSSVIT